MRDGDAGKLAVLMATAFIDMVGALMVYPLFPYYAKNLGATPFMITALGAVFSAMQLVSAPLWGRVSDRYGRKPTLLIGLGISAVAYVVFAFAHSYWLLLLSRLVQGTGGGTTGVIQAYVADSVQPKNRAKSLGWLSAATNLGVVLGPLSGSVATHWGASAPGLLAACLCLVNIGFAAKYLTESHNTGARARARTARTPREAVQRVLLHPAEPPSRLIWMYALGIGAFYGITAVLVLFLDERFNVTADKIGIFFAYMGSLNILFRLGVLGRVVEKIGEVRTSRLGAIILACGLATIPLTRPLPLPGVLSWLWLAAAVALLPLGTALNFPCVTAMLSRVVGEHERGLYMGVQQTFGGISRVVQQLWIGWAWQTLGISVPFWSSAVLVAFTAWLGRKLTPVVHTAEHPIPPQVVAPPRSGEHQVVPD